MDNGNSDRDYNHLYKCVLQDLKDDVFKCDECGKYFNIKHRCRTVKIVNGLRVFDIHCKKCVSFIKERAYTKVENDHT